MLILNLISHDLRKEIVLKNNYDNLKMIIGLFLFFFLSCATVLLFLKFYLNKNLEKIIEEKLSINEPSMQYSKKVKDFNNFANQVGKVQEKYFPASFFLKSLIHLIPANTEISAIKIDLEKRNFQLIGYVDNNETLVSLQNNLNQFDYLSKIDWPFKKQEDNKLEFSINGDLK